MQFHSSQRASPHSPVEPQDARRFRPGGLFVEDTHGGAHIRPALEKELRQLSRQPQAASYGWSYYINSSDSLAALSHAPSLANASVCTVAGSGDLPLLFAFLGASEVVVRDISLPACSMTELRLRAAQHFDFAEYWAMFPQHTTASNAPLKIFSPDGYKRLRDDLSTQSRTYLDLIQQPGYEVFFHARPFLPRRPTSFDEGLSWYGPVRSRVPASRSDAEARERYPFAASAEAFAVLKNSVLSTRFVIQCGALESFGRRSYRGFDYIYLSNVIGDSPAEAVSSAAHARWTMLSPRLGVSFLTPGRLAVAHGTNPPRRDAEVKAMYENHPSARLIAVDSARQLGAYVEYVNSTGAQNSFDPDSII